MNFPTDLDREVSLAQFTLGSHETSSDHTISYLMSEVWSGACWSLRKKYGSDKVDTAVRLTLVNLEDLPTITNAAEILQTQLAGTDTKIKKQVRLIFERRGVKISE